MRCFLNVTDRKERKKSSLGLRGYGVEKEEERRGCEALLLLFSLEYHVAVTEFQRCIRYVVALL